MQHELFDSTRLFTFETRRFMIRCNTLPDEIDKFEYKYNIHAQLWQQRECFTIVFARLLALIMYVCLYVKLYLNTLASKTIYSWLPRGVSHR